ncbi:hypothetical protein [Roseomonas chloroacetimidivorans]|uniref:hypothetical protein n=1 Tax=Roseomonas chloroacetimidivorans TaxID=1766656 RepID=UPI003C722D7E
MALGLSTGSSGEFKEYVKYDARAGRMFRPDRDGGGNKTDTDITMDKPKFIFDFGSIKVGWAKYVAGMGPEYMMVPLGHAMPTRPSPDHKQAFLAQLFAPKMLGGVREFSSSAGCVIEAVNELHTKFEAAPEAAEGKVPVVEFAGSTAVVSKGKGQSSTNYKPVFNIIGWQDRPAELGERTVPQPVKQLRPEPAVTTAAPSPAPVQTTAAMLEDAIPFAPEFR